MPLFISGMHIRQRKKEWKERGLGAIYINGHRLKKIPGTDRSVAYRIFECSALDLIAQNGEQGENNLHDKINPDLRRSEAI